MELISHRSILDPGAYTQWSDPLNAHGTCRHAAHGFRDLEAWCEVVSKQERFLALTSEDASTSRQGTHKLSAVVFARCLEQTHGLCLCSGMCQRIREMGEQQ